jgi:PAS domain-containing protein
VVGADDTIVGVSIDETLPEASSIITDHEHGTRVEEEFDVEVAGEQRFLVANVSSLYEGETLIGRLVLLRDVTERRSVQKRYQALIENSSDLILVGEPEGKVVAATQQI